MAYKIGQHIFVGDVIISNSIGRTDLHGGDVEKMKESLRKIRDLDFEVLHSGHGEDLDKATADLVALNWQSFL